MTTDIGACLRVHHDGKTVTAIEVRIPEYPDGPLAILGVHPDFYRNEAVMRAVRAENRILAKCGPSHDDFEHGRELEIAP